MNQKELDVLLVLFNMTTKDQIVQVIREARKPIKAREIARRFDLQFNEKISKGITETGDTIKNEIIESSKSSKENITNEISSFDPFSFIKNIFKTN